MNSQRNSVGSNVTYTSYEGDGTNCLKNWDTADHDRTH